MTRYSYSHYNLEFNHFGWTDKDGKKKIVKNVANFIDELEIRVPNEPIFYAIFHLN